MAVNKGPAYRVETERLLLRCWSPADAPNLRIALDKSAQHLRPWIPFMKDEPRSLIETANWLREHRARFDLGEYFRYAVVELATGELVGENMLLSRIGEGALEIGYLTHLGFDGRGYASEATCAMIRLAFEVHDMTRVEIHCSPQNEPSAAIPAKLGFRHEATLEDRVEATDGKVYPLMIWTLFAKDYEASPARQWSMKAYNCLGEPIELA